MLPQFGPGCDRSINFAMMKTFAVTVGRLIGLILTVLVLARGVAGAQAYQRPQDCGCTLWFPSDSLMHERTEEETPIGTLRLERYTSERVIGSRRMRMVFQFWEYPADSGMHHDSADLVAELFDATVSESVAAVMGKEEYRGERQVAGSPGIVWRVRFDRGRGLVKSLAFVRGNRFYNLQAVFPEELAGRPEIDEFLESFRFL